MQKQPHALRPAAPHRTVLSEADIAIPGVCLLGYNRNLFASTGIAPHVHEDAFELVYVVSGEIQFETDGESTALRGGDLYLTQPGRWHSTGAAPTGVCEFYWVQLRASCDSFLCLRAAEARELLHALCGVQACALHGEARFDKLFAALLRSAANSARPQALFCDAALFCVTALLQVLCEVLSRAVAARKPQPQPDIAAALAYAARHVEDEIALAEMARAAKLSLPRLKAKFMRQVGVPPRTYVNSIKIERACTLLRGGGSVTDTAFALGFSSANYFSVLFRKFTGQSPTQYRQGANAKGEETP